MSMKINKGFSSIEQVTGQYLSGGAKTVQNDTDSLSFEEILRKKQDVGLKFSRHASDRLNDRNIDLTGEQMERLNTAAKSAEGKGISNSLIMVDSYAFIVNIPNNTVITAMDSEETKSNIFTNIDGAVFG